MGQNAMKISSPLQYNVIHVIPHNQTT
jgi:hypothetical protein